MRQDYKHAREKAISVRLSLTPLYLILPPPLYSLSHSLVASLAAFLSQATALAVYPTHGSSQTTAQKPLSLSLSLPFSDSTPHTLCHGCETERDKHKRAIHKRELYA